jgi:hypothetical protein
MRQIDVNSLVQKRFFLLGPVLMLGAMAATVSEGVELYRCTRDGRVEFRQTACPDGEQTLTEVVDQSAGISPIEPALRLESTTPEEPSSVLETRQPRASEERCWKTRQRLEWVERRLRAGYKPSQYDGLHRKQAEYQDYLKRFCQVRPR